MPTTTDITDIGDQLDLTTYAGDFAQDYDWDAVKADYIDAINREVPEGVTVYGNGQVIAEVGEAADAARELDWHELLESIDVAPIFQRHDVTDRIREVPAATGVGTIFEGYDRDGHLVAAWGPDTLDGDGNAVEASDECWTATQWIDGSPRQTITDIKDVIEALGRKWMKG